MRIMKRSFLNDAIGIIINLGHFEWQLEIFEILEEENRGKERAWGGGGMDQLGREALVLLSSLE